MKIGDLNKRIEIQSYTDTADGMGGFTRVWATAYKKWAAIWPVSANEVVAANATSMLVSHRIRIRYCAGCVTGKDRIKFGTRYFAITSVLNPNEANEWYDIMCKEAA
jgi:SPP1 family predicted phage head-tail adaptor